LRGIQSAEAKATGLLKRLTRLADSIHWESGLTHVWNVPGATHCFITNGYVWILAATSMERETVMVVGELPGHDCLLFKRKAIRTRMS
jgi:hypothetical protein